MTDIRPAGVPAQRHERFRRSESNVTLDAPGTGAEISPDFDSDDEPQRPLADGTFAARELGHHDPELYVGKTITIEKDGQLIQGTLHAHELHLFQLHVGDTRTVDIVAVAVLVGDTSVVLAGSDLVTIDS